MKSDAISRAWFFLGLAKVSTADEQEHFEAFLEAAIVFSRASLHRFKKRHNNHLECSAWWLSIKDHPAVVFFRRERDFILKERPPLLGRKIMFAVDIGQQGDEPIVREIGQKLASESYYFRDPHEPATDTVEHHLVSLASILSTAEGRCRVER